jgi:superfamily II DNA/RNA helicase
LLVASPSGARGLDLHGIDLVIIMGVPTTADAFVHMAGRTARQGSVGHVVVLTTEDEANARLPLLGSQLGLDVSRKQVAAAPDLPSTAVSRRHVEERDEKWAETWRVHEKIIHAEEKALQARTRGNAVKAKASSNGARTKREKRRVRRTRPAS